MASNTIATCAKNRIRAGVKSKVLLSTDWLQTHSQHPEE